MFKIGGHLGVIIGFGHTDVFQRALLATTTFYGLGNIAVAEERVHLLGILPCSMP